jgi:hypothetical protein
MTTISIKKLNVYFCLSSTMYLYYNRQYSNQQRHHMSRYESYNDTNASSNDTDVNNFNNVKHKNESRNYSRTSSRSSSENNRSPNSRNSNKKLKKSDQQQQPQQQPPPQQQQSQPTSSLSNNTGSKSSSSDVVQTQQPPPQTTNTSKSPNINNHNQNEQHYPTKNERIHDSDLAQISHAVSSENLSTNEINNQSSNSLNTSVEAGASNNSTLSVPHTESTRPEDPRRLSASKDLHQDINAHKAAEETKPGTSGIVSTNGGTNYFQPQISSTAEDINKYYRPELVTRLSNCLGVVEVNWIFFRYTY